MCASRCCLIKGKEFDDERLKLDYTRFKLRAPLKIALSGVNGID
jgi:hypothetical protein